MKNCNLSEFINKTPKQQTEYFNNVILVDPALDWENALLFAIEHKDVKCISLYSGLIPFYNTNPKLEVEKPKTTAPVKKVKRSKK